MPLSAYINEAVLLSCNTAFLLYHDECNLLPLLNTLLTNWVNCSYAICIGIRVNELSQLKLLAMFLTKIRASAIGSVERKISLPEDEQRRIATDNGTGKQ